LLQLLPLFNRNRTTFTATDMFPGL